MSLEDLALTDRIYDLLSSSGYETIGDLMFQLALDEDAVLGISGIGPKAMEEIKEKLTNISYPSAQPEEVLPEVVEQVEPVVESLAEVSPTPTEEIITLEQPETIVEGPSAQLAAIEEGTPAIEEASAEPEIVSAEQVPTATSELKEEEVEKPVDFNEIFALRPEILGIQNTEEEEEEEDLDKKGKKKKKKKKFVEVVYDPDRDITLVKRKRKRGGDWEDDWNF
jgi:hypothetical protein